MPGKQVRQTRRAMRQLNLNLTGIPTAQTHLYYYPSVSLSRATILMRL